VGALEASADDELRARGRPCARDIDRAFLGTIHAFCARLLRERPLEAGLDPGFRETLGSEEASLQRQFWLNHLERLSAAGDGELAALAELGIEPRQLWKLFGQLVAQPDVRFDAEPCLRPDAGAVRRRIEDILDRAAALLPRSRPNAGWDPLQSTIRRLGFHRRLHGWEQDVRFLEAIGGLGRSALEVRQNRWLDGKAARTPGGTGRAVRRRWSSRPAAAALVGLPLPARVAFAQRAAKAYERERLRAGTLNFQDLLTFAARMLSGGREDPSQGSGRPPSGAARRELGERYRYLLVDEFQDTDPVQAEVLFLLASEPSAGGWRRAVPRPGALFVVGDPKQSIYRFRRADMTLDAQVKARFAEFGAVLGLVANFRSGKAVEEFVNQTFQSRFPAQSDQTQAGLRPCWCGLARTTTRARRASSGTSSTTPSTRRWTSWPDRTRSALRRGSRSAS
jgi:ATP-dependent helicase/nuclease subunit A